jgi:hypothetical protein
MAVTPLPALNQSSLTVNVFDGTRRPFSAPVDILYRVFDGTTKQVADPMKQVASLNFNVPFFNNLFDNYRVIVSAKGFQQAGYTPVKLSPQTPQTLDLMLLPKDPQFNFAQAAWDAIKAVLPFLAAGVDANTARERYNDLMEDKPKSLASLLNITSSMAQMRLPDGSKPLDYFKEIKWDASLAQDRFYAYCDVKLIGAVRDAAAHHMFAEEPNPGAFHPGATKSWKQILFDEANVQLTFHEGDTKVIGGVDCVKVEPDIDYYKDLISHTILEVIPNKFTGGLTEPALVYVLRWIVGRRAGGDFNPPYVIV